jgi:aspartate carbamoyltransferase regulatory subunit
LRVFSARRAGKTLAGQVFYLRLLHKVFPEREFQMTETELRVSKIKDGTVIDHITSGHALDVVRILGITGKEETPITIAINVPSKRLKRKDIVKIEGRELKPQEVHKIALIAPHASINIVRDYKVIKKDEVKLPSIIDNIIKCTNPACISNSNEPVKAKFYVDSEEPLLLKCHYCGYFVEKKDVLQQF